MKRIVCVLLGICTLFSAVSATALAQGTARNNTWQQVSFGSSAGYYGDLDEDGGINASDALVVLKNVVGKQSFTDAQTKRADVNADASVGASDALEILRYVVGKTEQFKAGDAYDAYTLSDYEYADPFAVYKPYKESDFPYDTSLSVNGAYATDASADCSFVMDNTGLQQKTIYRLSSYVVSNKDKARLVYSLQGLVNRDFGLDANHTSLIYVSADDSDESWLAYLRANGSVFAGYSVVDVTSWDSFYTIFRHQIQSCGLILWDGNVPATANVAATICGLDGYLPVIATSSLHEQLVADGIEVKQSLVGLFENGKKGEKVAGTQVISTGSAKNDAYRWAMAKYFPRCSYNYLAYTLDGAVCVYGYSDYDDNPICDTSRNLRENGLKNHDYLIARRAFFFDLHPYGKEEVCDDLAQQETMTLPCPDCGTWDTFLVESLMGLDDPVCSNCGLEYPIDWDLVHGEGLMGSMADIGTDNETLLQLLALRYERAKGGMGQMMGFPPWWSKYTLDSSSGNKAATWIEWLFCEYISCYNMAKEADAAQPASMTNGSAYYKYVPRKASYDNNWEAYDAGVTYDPETTYFTIYMGDYDSSAWLKKYVNEFWLKNGGDSARGALPLTWCFNPNLSLRVPMVFDYIYANKKSNEFIAAGDSGAGYVIPSGLFSGMKLSYTGEPRPAQYTSGDRMWADYCKAFYDRFDMKATGFIINGANYLNTDVLGMFNTFSTKGGLHNVQSAPMTQYKDGAYVYCHNGIDAGTGMDVLYSHAVNGMSGYHFAAYRTICMSPSNVRRVVNNFTTYANAKGTPVQYLELYTFLDFAAQSNEGFIVK